MPEEEVSGNGFTIKDKRSFDSKGDLKEKTEDVKIEEKEEKTEEKRDYIPLPEVNFSSFLISLSSSVLLNLGEIADPVSGKKTQNMELAKQSIDIINMLKDKTNGNLEEEEKKLLESLLYDLKMRFVEAIK